MVAPAEVDGVSQCVVSLNGQWQFNEHPPEKSWLAGGKGESWQPIRVPGEAAMQGFKLEHDTECAYRRTFTVPADFARKRVFIRLDGVYSFARVWVNGKFLRDHHGGFTSWHCDITPFVEPGKEAELVVGVTDRKDEISYASGYAKHKIGGILRDVSLLCLPVEPIIQLNVETNLDEQYQDATLKVQAAAAFTGSDRGILKLQLSDPNGATVNIAPNSVKLTRRKPSATVEIPVVQPLKWDAEHPYLYTLMAEWIVEGRGEQKIVQNVGFREVEVNGNQLLVNGAPVKLRGVCRHDMHGWLSWQSSTSLGPLTIRRPTHFSSSATATESMWKPSRPFASSEAKSLMATTGLPTMTLNSPIGISGNCRRW